jgi:hypothetical protein
MYGAHGPCQPLEHAQVHRSAHSQGRALHGSRRSCPGEAIGGSRGSSTRASRAAPEWDSEEMQSCSDVDVFMAPCPPGDCTARVQVRARRASPAGNMSLVVDMSAPISVLNPISSVFRARHRQGTQSVRRTPGRSPATQASRPPRRAQHPKGGEDCIMWYRPRSRLSSPHPAPPAVPPCAVIASLHRRRDLLGIPRPDGGPVFEAGKASFSASTARGARSQLPQPRSA